MSLKRFAAMLMLTFATFAAGNSVASSVRAQGGKTLTNDPLTGLPIPPSEDRLHLGNEPQTMDPLQMCKSTMKSNFYSPNGIKMNATAAWYESKLTGFKKVVGLHNNRATVTFYKPDGTVAVSLTGTPAPPGQDSEVHGIVYATFIPPLPEKAFAGMTTGNVVCP